MRLPATILAIIGEGGFGKVYRASMRGGDGFCKEVAIKLMLAEGLPEEALVRFRDEARILGLVRDRAIVSADPPTRLNGRLAVVMEYIEGASASALLSSRAFPATVAIEVVQEVARVLDKVVRHPGPDGRPLNLLHRDLKPANLQITAGGEVKVLDFGIARATFDAREAHTMANVAGTLGYTAPERLTGIEVPAGDIYSLGVVLHVLVTRDKAVTHGVFTRRGPLVERTPAVLAAIALAAEMCNVDPGARPTARQVEDRCQELRREHGGPTLRAWAERHVQAAPPLEPDELVGGTFCETATSPDPASVPAEPIQPLKPADPAPAGLRWPALGAVAVLLLGGAIGIAAAGGRGAPSESVREAHPVLATPTALAEPPFRTPVPAASMEPPVPTPVSAAPPEPVPAPLVQAAPEERLVAVKPAVPSPASPPTRIPASPGFVPLEQVQPAPLPSAPAPGVVARAVAAVALWPVTFASVPGGADVRIDGVSIGASPVLNHPLPGGEFAVTMVYPSGESIERTIHAGARAPTRYVWDQQAGGTWNSY